jgi:hypothetical protein
MVHVATCLLLFDESSSHRLDRLLLSRYANLKEF